MFQNFWYQLGRWVIYLYLRFIIRADIYRSDAFPRGAKIIAVNHPTTNDPAFVTALLAEHTSILIKETVFKIPLFGRSLRMAGHVPVIAGKGQAALEEGIRLLRAGRTVMIFPEGEISPGAGALKPHTGVARLALATGAPVIPVGIGLETHKIRYVTSKIAGEMEPSAWYLRGPYAMTVGEALFFEGNPEDREQVRAVTTQVMQRILLLSRASQFRLAAQHARQSVQPTLTSRLGKVNPKAGLQVAWKGTGLAIGHTGRMISRSTVFRLAESGSGVLNDVFPFDCEVITGSLNISVRQLAPCVPDSSVNG